MALITKNGDQAASATDAPKIEFPCENYVVKVVALDVEDGHTQIVECMQIHAPDMGPKAHNVNRSSKGRFVSYSFRILAESEGQLSKLHKDLMALDAVKMVL